MEPGHELNKRRTAPAELWIGLALLTIATIIALILLSNDGRNIEKKISYLKTELYGKEKI